VEAVPFPMPDQRGYHAAEGDAVLMLAGRDGRMYAIPDNNCFVGEVLATGRDVGGGVVDDSKESNFGGAGQGTICVRRVLMSGDPTADAYTLDPAKTTIIYNYVKVLVVAGQHAGHRMGSYVLCFRRGQYIYALPARGIYAGETVTAGPDNEADLTGAYHWVSVKAYGVTYPVGSKTNDWVWAAGDDDTLFTICACNLASDTHQAAGKKVMVTLFAGSRAGTAKGEGYWLFSRCDGETAAKDALCIDADYSPQYATGNSDPHWDHMGGAVSKTGTLGAGGGTTNSALSYVTGHMYLDSNGDYNPWFVIDLSSYPTDDEVDAKFCESTFYPYDWAAGTPAKTQLTQAYNATATEGTAAYYITGFMGDDGTGKLNPFVFIDPGKFLCQDPTYYPYGWTADGKTVLADAYNATGASGATTFYVKGQMARDVGTPIKWNPWFFINPEKFLCVAAVVGDEVTDTLYHAKGHMYWDATAKQYNPWVPIPIRGDGVDAGDDIWIFVEPDGDILRIKHNLPGPEEFVTGSTVNACVVLCKISLDGLGHVRTVSQADRTTGNVITSVGPSYVPP
jgi:hypothetical protein